MFKRFTSLPIDWFLVLIPIVLLVTGIVTIYTMTYADYGWRLAQDQLVYGGLGLALYAFFMFYDYRQLHRIAFLLYLAGIVLMVPLLPMIASKLPFVSTVFGARRWIDLGVFQLQPSEVFKFVGSIGAAAYLTAISSRLGFKQLAGYVALTVVPLAMIALQPNLGTTIVVFVIFATMFLAAKPKWRILAVLLLIMAIVVPLTVANLRPYQKARVETFLNPASATKAERYNVEQALIAVGSGGLMGRGFGQGSQTVLNFLPVAHADFIFAGFAEATGFVGSVALLGVYLLLLQRLITTAQLSTDQFGRILTYGFTAKIFFQLVIHVGMNLGLMPVTGIPLQLMSYGGTSLIIDMVILGVVQSIYIRHQRSLF